MLVLYVAVLGALAFLTAYTQNFQRTILTLGEAIGHAAATTMMPREQWLRMTVVAVGWPLAFGLGLAFVAWWKAVALVCGAFVLLVPVMGSFTPRPMSRRYLERIRSDLARRIAAGAADADELRPLLEKVERIATGRPARPRR